MRTNIALASVLCASAAAWAAPAASQPATAKGPRVVRLTLGPAAEPRPVMKYVLQPAFIDEEPSNAESTMFLTGQLVSQLAGKQSWDEFYRHVADWNDLPVDRRPRNQIDALLTEATRALHYADLAARHEYCHWSVPLKSEGFAGELPRLQAFRLAIRLLSLRADFAVANHRYDSAAADLRTAIQVARWCQGQTLINDLVSVSCMDMIKRSLEFWVGQADAPNLYWALAQLPRPFVDARETYEMEGMLLFMDLPELRNLDAKLLAPAEADALVVRLVQMWPRYAMEHGAGRWASVEEAKAFIKEREAASREYLLKQGYKRETLQAMPAAQVVILENLDVLAQYRDEQLKWLLLPYWQAYPQVADASRRVTALRKEMAPRFPFVELLAPLENAHFAIARADRTIAVLQLIEAIRMHMARGGSAGLPKSLEEITIVPLPLDPITGKPFVYKTSAGGATLVCPSPSADRPEDETRYELNPR